MQNSSGDQSPIVDGSGNPYQAPPVLAGGNSLLPMHGEGDQTGGLIPYKNPQALIAYYLGIGSLLPCVGILFAIPAVILGILGLAARKRTPAIRGSVHAWIGIILGGLFGLLWTAVIVLFFIGAYVDSQR